MSKGKIKLRPRILKRLKKQQTAKMELEGHFYGINPKTHGDKLHLIPKMQPSFEALLKTHPEWRAHKLQGRILGLLKTCAFTDAEQQEINAALDRALNPKISDRRA